MKRFFLLFLLPVLLFGQTPIVQTVGDPGDTLRQGIIDVENLFIIRPIADTLSKAIPNALYTFEYKLYIGTADSCYIPAASKWEAGSTVNAIKPKVGKTVEADSGKFGALEVTGNARFDGNVTLVTTASESLIVPAGGIRNEGGMLQKGAATFGKTGTQATIATTGKITTPDSLVSTLGIRTEGPSRLKGAATFGATATPILIDSDGQMLIGANAPAASSTIGLTIDEGANSTNVLVFRSSTVGHKMTGIIETSAYGALAKGNAAGGGVLLSGFSENDIAAATIDGSMNAFSTNASAAVEFIARKRASTLRGALAETDNAFKWKNHNTHLATMLGNGNMGYGTTSPLAKVSLVGTDGTGTGLHIVSRDVNKLRTTWAQANDSSSISILLDSNGNPRFGLAAADKDSARISVRGDSTEINSQNAIAINAPAVAANGTYGNNAEQPVTLAESATTLAITKNNVAVTGDAAGNTVATITGAGPVGLYTFRFIDDKVTITDTAEGTANTVNLSAAFTSSADDILVLYWNGTSWREASRSVN
jgi:hypothetical protein